MPTYPKTREYHLSGRVLVDKAKPFLVDRVSSPQVPDSELTELELAVRAWRNEILDDLGGEESVSAAKKALLDAAVGTFVVLHTIDHYLFALGKGMVNKRDRKLYAVVTDRMRVADSLTRQLQALGLERKERPPVSLKDYVEAGGADEGPQTETI